MIPAGSGIITYRSKKTRIPKQNKTLSSIGFEHKIHKRRDRICFLLGSDLRSPGWEPIVVTRRLHSDITALCCGYIFYISINKVLEQPWRYFTSRILCKCSWTLHPLPREASTSPLALSSASTPHTLNYITPLQEGQRRSFRPLE